MKHGRTKAATDVIAKKIGYLLSVGATAKANEWVSSDKALTQITAERYLLDYLRKKNTNFKIHLLEEVFVLLATDNHHQKLTILDRKICGKTV